jgi:hypothetical protein
MGGARKSILANCATQFATRGRLLEDRPREAGRVDRKRTPSASADDGDRLNPEAAKAANYVIDRIVH